MQHLLRAVTVAVEQRNWYAALSTALALPDICGWLEDPASGSQRRYIRWFDRFVGPEYIREVGPDREKHVFLSGGDCYALRCAFLHEGRDEIITQRAREALDRFQFVVPPHTWTVHCNQFGSKLQLQVDVFCLQVVRGSERWIDQVGGRAEVVARISDLLRIYTADGKPLE